MQPQLRLACFFIGIVISSVYGNVNETDISNLYFVRDSSSVVVGSYLQIIPQTTSVKGQAWYNTPQYIEFGFQASMTLDLVGDETAGFGDGICFVVSGQTKNQLLTNTLYDGGQLAISNMPNMVAIAFDLTFNQIHFCTAADNETLPLRQDWVTGGFCSTPLNFDVPPGIHDITIKYEPNHISGEADWTLDINGNKQYFLGKRDVIASADDRYMIGFAGSAGSSTSQIRVTSWDLQFFSPCDTNNGGCSADATCTFDQAITMNCTCNDGFVGNGYTCNVPPIAAPIDPPVTAPIDSPITAPVVVDSPVAAPVEPPVTEVIPPSQEVPIEVIVPAVVVPVVAATAGAILLALLLKRRKRLQSKKKTDDNESADGGSTAMLAQNTYGTVPGIELAPTGYGTIPDRSEGGPGNEEEINPIGIKPSEIDKRMHIAYKSLVFTKEIGSGSFGKVFLGSWRGAQVAIKVNNTVTDMEGFLAEAKLTLGITPHPNLVQTFGVSLDGAYPCIVLEFCGGGSLDTLVFNKKSSITNEKKREFALKIAYGLMHLHNNNIVHRDLAVRNILLTSEGQPKISDFGMSRIIQDEASKGKTKTDVGPLRWMAPESLQDKVYSVKSDVWSYGILLWEIIAGREPHGDEDQLYVGVKIRDDAFTPTIPDDCDPVLREVMQMCWKRDPNERPTVEEITDYIQEH